MNVEDFLEIKCRPVITIGPDKTIQAALKKLVDNNIGALPVCDSKGVMLGIITERDLLKECLQNITQVSSTTIKDVMTKEVAISVPEDNIDYIISAMTKKKIRHIPVVGGSKLVGMISARDLVESQLEEYKADVRYYNDYISLLSVILQYTDD